MLMRYRIALAFAICQLPLLALEVHPDRTVTFTYTAADAQEVSVSGDFGRRGELTKGERGTWSVTLGPFEPDIHSYSFSVDGRQVADPLNNRSKPQRSGISNVFEIRGDQPSVWDRQSVAHGVVHLHEYDSKSTGTTRRLRVYTPPGYEAGDQRHPVLYLFHGSGDNEATWTDFGRAHVILDNLIATGEAKPMLIVMPDGHADLEDEEGIDRRNLEEFEQDILGSLVPLVDKHYRTRRDSAHRAICGLSMGGIQSLFIGLRHPDLFAWIGGMSAWLPEPEKYCPDALSSADLDKNLRLLWVQIGRDDPYLPDYQKFDAVMQQHGIKRQFRLTEGSHTWPLWRGYFVEFAPLLFR